MLDGGVSRKRRTTRRFEIYSIDESRSLNKSLKLGSLHDTSRGLISVFGRGQARYGQARPAKSESANIEPRPVLVFRAT
jgi:hypothetical protein